jgi:hypothetical protein
VVQYSTCNQVLACMLNGASFQNPRFCYMTCLMHLQLQTQTVDSCAAKLCCDMQCSIFEHRSYKVIYRRYASLFFMVGVDDDEVCRSCWHM